MNKPDFELDVDNPTCVEQLHELLGNDKLRLKVYQYMIIYLNIRKEHKVSGGMCYCVPEFIRDVPDDFLHIRLRVLPELWKYNPGNSDNGNYWFPQYDFDTRLEILNKIVDKLTKKINKTNS
jgi:hypothetical protein